MITELFGDEILDMKLDEVKQKIRTLPPSQAERRSYLLHDWAAATGKNVTKEDFDDVKQ